MFEETAVMCMEERGQKNQKPYSKGFEETREEEKVKESPQAKEIEKKLVRILIVDDESHMLEAFMDVLEQKGYDVQVVESGEDAIDKAKEKPFNIIFMDIRLPGINGVETLHAIKELSPKTLFVMITAYDLPHLVKKAIAEGAYTHFQKPFDIDKIIELIESYRKMGI